MAIGHIPRSELLVGQVDLDDNGYVLVKDGSTATNVTGVFGEKKSSPFSRYAFTSGHRRLHPVRSSTIVPAAI